MKFLFFGSPAFARVHLDRLLQYLSRHSDDELLAIITQPDKPAGRGRDLTACETARRARETAIPLLQPTRLKDPDLHAELRAFKPDLAIVVAYGRILPDALLAIPKHGFINIHASILPAYRGAAPIQRAIMAGECETGVTAMKVATELDAGDILDIAKTPILPTDTTESLTARLAELGADLLIQTLDALKQKEAQGETLIGTPQDARRVSFAPPLRKEEGILDWRQNADALFNQIRGVTPWPGAFASIFGKRVKIGRAAPPSIPHEPHTASPGTVLHVAPHALDIACGTGVLTLEILQLDGKRPLAIGDLVNGFPIRVGDCFDTMTEDR